MLIWGNTVHGYANLKKPLHGLVCQDYTFLGNFSEPYKKLKN